MALTVVPFAIALVLASFVLPSDQVYWRFGVTWLRGMIWVARVVGGIEYRVQGWEHLPTKPDQRVILCPKHQSTWETFFLPSIMPHPLAYVFKRELLMIPFFGWGIGRLDMIHIDRSARALAWQKVAEQGAAVMDRGKWVIMFPEGTRTARGASPPYKSGAARLALASGAVIVPIAIASGRCWPRRSFMLTPGVIDVVIGTPIVPKPEQSPSDLMAEVEAWIENTMRQIDAEAYHP
jgi:1-acyl-sn-glycerol-3-phosphate acyltransferase